MNTSEKDKKKKEAAADAITDKIEASSNSSRSSVFGRRMVDLDAKIPLANNDEVQPSADSYGEIPNGTDAPDDGGTLSNDPKSVSDGNDSEQDNPESLLDAVKRDREERAANNSAEDDGMDDRMLSNDEDNQSPEGPEEENAEETDDENGETSPEDADDNIENPKNEKEQKYGKWHKDDKLRKQKEHEQYLIRQREEQEYYNQQQAEETRQREEEEYLSRNRTHQQEEQSVYHNHNSASQKTEAESLYQNVQFGKHEDQTFSGTLSHPSSEEYMSRDVPASPSVEDDSYLQQSVTRSERNDQDSSGYINHEEHRSSEESPYRGIQPARSGQSFSDRGSDSRPSAESYLNQENAASQTEEGSVYLKQDRAEQEENSYLSRETTKNTSDSSYLASQKTPDTESSYMPADRHTAAETPYLHNEAEQTYGHSNSGSRENGNGGQQGFPQTTGYDGSPTIVSPTENTLHPDGFADQEAADSKTAGIVYRGQEYADESHTDAGQNFGSPQANAAMPGTTAAIPAGADMAVTENYFSAKGIQLASMDNDAVQRAVGRGSINGMLLSGREQEAIQNYLSARKTQSFLEKENHSNSDAGLSPEARKGAMPISRNATVGNGGLSGSAAGLTGAGGAMSQGGMPAEAGKPSSGGRKISRNTTVVTRGAEGSAEPTKGMTANEILQFRKMQQKTERKGPWVVPGKGKKADGPYLSLCISSDGKPYLGQTVLSKEAENGPYLAENGKNASSPLSAMTAAQRLLYLKANGKINIVGKENSVPEQSMDFSDDPAYVTIDRTEKSGPQAVRGPLTLGNVRNKVYISHGQITGVDQLAGKARMVHPEDGNLTGKASMDRSLAGKSSTKDVDAVNVLSSGKARIGKVQNTAMDKLSGENGLGLSPNDKLTAGASVGRKKMSFGQTIGRPEVQGPTGKMNDPATVSDMWKKNQPKIFKRALLAKQKNAGGNPINSVLFPMPSKGMGKGIGGSSDGILSVLKKGMILVLILALFGQFSEGMISTVLALTPRAAMVDMDGNELEDYGTYPGTDYNATNTSSSTTSESTGSTVSDVADPTPSGDGTYKYGDYTITERDIKWMTAVVCHEEGWDLATHDERIGIAAIILHHLVRNEQGWPNTIQGVINQPNQFFPLTDAEVNAYSTDPRYSKNYADCRRAVIEAVCGVDPTGGAVGEVASYVDPTKLVLVKIWQKQIGRTIFFGWGNTPQVSTTTLVGGGNFNGGTKAITQNAVNAMLNVEYEAMQKAQEEGREYQLISNNKSTAFENLSIYSISCNGTSLATNTVTARNYLGFTTDYTYYGQPIKKGTGSSKVTHIQKPKMKQLKDSDKTGDTLTITYHGTNTTVTHTYYSGSKTQQYFGNCGGMEDTLDIDNKSLLGWAFQELADGTEADDSIIAFDRYDKISGDTISMLSEQYGGHLDLYAVYANEKARVKHDKIGVFTNDDLSKGADEYLNGDKAVTIRYAYRDKNGNMNYTDQNSAVTSAARAQIYKNILAMATIVTGNQTKHPERYVRYCEERMRDVIGGYAGVSIDYTPVKLSGGTHDKDFRYTWYDGFTKYVAPGARLKVTATIYVTQNLEAMCEHDPTNESYFDDNPDFFTFPGWTKSNINQAEVYAQMEDKEFCTLFNVIIPEIDPTLISGSGDGSDIVAAAIEEYNSYHGQLGGMKYISWYGGFSPGTPWCNIFVSYVANKCGYIQSGIIPKGSLCSWTYSWFEKKGLTHRSGTYTPKAGDLIFFGNNASQHIGIVEKCENGVVYTIEGNHSNTVDRVTRPLGNGNIWGYASPQYPSSVTSGDGSESYVYKALKQQGLNDAAIAGIMGNMQYEGGVTGWHNAQNSSYATDAGDRQYTAAVDNGTISRNQFINDGIGYGPVQLTYYTFKAALYDNAKAAHKSIGDPGIMMTTIIQLYKSHFAQMNAAGSPEAAAEYWLYNVERPASPNPSQRNAGARTYYNKILAGSYK